MTNHPNRRRDVTGEAEQDLETAETMARELGAGEQELHPAAPGDIPPQGSAEMPAHTPNGLPPGLKPNAAKQIGDAAGAAMAGQLGAMLPQALADAFAFVLKQVPVQAVTQQHACATCVVTRINWENIHRAEIEAAMEAAAHAAGVQPGTMQAAQLDFTVFLPEQLRPGQPKGMPDVQQAITTCQGTDACAMHIPGVQAGRPALLVATATMNPGALAQFAGVR